MSRVPLLLAAGLLSVAAVTGCGDDNAESLALLQASGAKATDSGTSRLSLESTTKLGAQSVTIKGEGSFDYVKDTGTFDLNVGAPGGGGGVIRERIVDGLLYISLPGRPGFYRLDLDSLAGTSLGASTDPASALSSLRGVSGDIEEVGQEQVRGEPTTHYRGGVDVQKAIAAATGPTKAQLEATLGRSGTDTVPFDAYVDKQGRLRRYVQELKPQIGGQAGEQGGAAQAASTTTIEVYDFGVPVQVTAPPAAQVQDGKPLLDALKSGQR